MTALQEAEAFLWKHPQATTDADNPVELLRDVVSEAEDLEHQLENAVDQSDLDAKDAEISKLEQKLEHYDRLVAFVRNLNTQQKISDFELRAALGKS